MFKTIMGILLLLSACAPTTADIQRSEASHLSEAKRHIFEVDNVSYARNHLHLALEKFNSAKAAVLLARLEIGKVSTRPIDEQRVIKLVEPYRHENGQAAYLYGLMHYPTNIEVALESFERASQDDIAPAFLYLASIYKWDALDSIKAKINLRKAIQNGCDKAIHFQTLIEKPDFESPRYIELLRLSAEAHNVTSLKSLAAYISPLSQDEANYLERLADIYRTEYINRHQVSIYDLMAPCQRIP